MRKALLVFLCLILTGCMYTYTNVNTAKRYEPLVKREKFAVSFDKAWGELNKLIVISRGAIKIDNKESGLITFEKYLSGEELKNYAIIPRYVPIVSAIAEVNFLVVKIESDVTEIIVSARILIMSKTNTSELAAKLCQGELKSTGLLEKEYIEKIQSILPLLKNK
ncbi:MAG: hypothetical protein WC431_00440 [Candidatus Omnitrophota bacterium]|jgi:hypothetical protein